MHQNAAGVVVEFCTRVCTHKVRYLKRQCVFALNDHLGFLMVMQTHATFINIVLAHKLARMCACVTHITREIFV